MPRNTKPDPRILFDVVTTAGRHIRNNFRNPGTIIELKADGSPVTDVDMAVHNELMDYAGNFGMGYISEEGNGSIEGDYILYLDPLDGTSSFRAGIPTVTIAVSVMKRMTGLWYKPVTSLVHDPLTGWSWFCDSDQSFFTVERSLVNAQEANVTQSAQALITTIFPPGPLRELRYVRDRINSNQPYMKHQSCGSLALCGGLIASGMTHGLIFGGGSAAEVCAMIPILEGAGATVSDLAGKPLEGFELGDHKGKVDFVLPNGFIAASDSELWRTLYTLVEEERAGM